MLLFRPTALADAPRKPAKGGQAQSDSYRIRIICRYFYPGFFSFLRKEPVSIIAFADNFVKEKGGVFTATTTSLKRLKNTSPGHRPGEKSAPKKTEHPPQPSTGKNEICTEGNNLLLLDVGFDGDFTLRCQYLNHVDRF
jgi:hypothetical protein